MSKLIVEMKIPCNIQYLAGLHGTPTCPIEKRICKDANNPPKWCPIKGVLPDEHGDLIDIDVAIQTFKCIEEAPYSGFDGQEAFYTPEDVVNTLLCQDVVIAAERKDNGN